MAEWLTPGRLMSWWPSPVTRKNVPEANFPVSGFPLSCVTCLAYFFAAFGLALARFSFRTEGRVARGLTGDLAR